jgi:outer membrane receptor protein involved in Fe transport
MNFVFCHAQVTVTGRLVDMNEEPLIGVNMIAYQNETLIKGEVADTLGRFSLNLMPGSYRINATYLEYNLMDSLMTIRNPIDLGTLKFDVGIILDEVVVAGYMPIIQDKGDRIRFHVANSKIAEGYNALEVLQRSPKITPGMSGGITIRDKPVTILMNGQKLNIPASAVSGYLANIKSENIEAVEIQTVKTSDMEADTEGGIVNIILKEPQIGFNGRIGALHDYTGKGLNENIIFGNINRGTDYFNIYANYSFDYGKNYFSRSDVDYLYKESGLNIKNASDNYGYTRKHVYSVGFTATPWKSHLFGAEFSGNNSLPPNSYSTTDISIRDTDMIDNGIEQSDFKSRNNIYTGLLNYTWSISEKSNLKLAAGYVNETSTQTNNISTVYDLGNYEDSKMINDTNGNTDMLSYQGDYTKKWTKSELKMGAKYITTNRESDYAAFVFENDNWNESDLSTYYNYGENVLSSYVQGKTSIGEKLSVNAGIRIENTRLYSNNNDDVKQNYTKWFPSFHALLNTSDKSSLSLAFTRNLRRPSFRLMNNYTNKISDFLYDVGNPNLKPEYANTFELNYNISKHRISAYYNLTSDKINELFYTKNDIVYHTNSNMGKNHEVRIEYNFSGNSTKWWYISSNASIYYIHIPESYYKKEKITALISLYNIFTINEKSMFEVAGHYCSPWIAPNKENAAQFGVDMAYRHSFFNKSLRLTLYCSDVFNTRKSKSTVRYDYLDYNFYQKAKTRSFTVSLSYYFQSSKKIKDSKNTNVNEFMNRL